MLVKLRIGRIEFLFVDCCDIVKFTMLLMKSEIDQNLHIYCNNKKLKNKSHHINISNALAQINSFQNLILLKRLNNFFNQLQ